MSNLGSDSITATTNTSRDPWQEALSKWQTVPASKVSQAAEIIRGLAGSWAASYQFDAGASNIVRATDANIPNPQVLKSLKIGQPGFPEINFAPYNWGTNRFGSKGGSFLGHPISFSVVGPTAKDQDVNDFQWEVSLVGGQYVLTLNQTVETIADLYGISNLADYPGGLYILISLTGSNATVDGAPGGIGDGCVIDPPVAVGYTGIIPLTENSKYEIFRVDDVGATSITLNANKSLARYFNVGVANPVVKAITFIQPEATRLVAVPGTSLTGDPKDAQVYAVVPPRRALLGDERVTYLKWTTAPSWNEYNLTDFDLLQGTEAYYKYGPKLPIPRSLGTWQGRLRGVDPATALPEVDVPCEAGTFILHPTATPGYTENLVGKILHVKAIRSLMRAHLRIGATTGYQADLAALQGWFEVVGRVGPAAPAQPTYWIVRRIEECSPETGFSYTGAGEYFTVDSVDPAPTVGEGIFVDATVHEPVTSLWDTTYADVDKIASARITNLIDPRWTERSAKNTGINPARADRAVFDTTPDANPGSLLDLGFRMVLFPSKRGTEGIVPILVPDWDKPVTSHEILLDPSKPDEKQYLEVDYANGLVRLSHPVKPGSVLYGDMSTDNARGEVVLFASCVPYSMEEGQLGASIRVTGGSPDGADIAYCGDTPGTTDTVDVFSDRIVAPCRVDPAQTVNSDHVLDAAPQDVVLLGDWRYRIPQAGFFELLKGSDATGDTTIPNVNGTWRGTLFGYSSVRKTTVGGVVYTTLKNVFGGGKTGVSTYIINSANPAVAVFRRELRLPNDASGTAGVPYQFDTTYGSAKRTAAVRFDDADLVGNADGSVTVKAKGTQTRNLTENFDDLFSSWILQRGSVSKSGLDITVAPHTILMRGQRMVTQESTVTLPAVDDAYYLFFEHNDGKSCPVCTYTTDFPLANPEDILIAKVVVSGGGALATITALQNPLGDIDRRLDLYVGEIGLDSWASVPNFPSLATAVEYANEIMNPDSGGRPYKNVRILVGGKTEELGANLPIQIKTDGLIIEGVPLYDTNPAVASAAGISEISWSDSTKSLFDLNGHSDLVFRNLAIRFLAAVDPNVTTNSVFTCSTGDPAYITIENCRVAGYVYNFIDVSSVTTQFTDAEIRNNVAPLLSGAGFKCANKTVARVRIEGNTWTADPANRGTFGVFIAKGVDPTFYDTPLMQMLVIRNNIFSSFDYGIWVGSGTAIIDNNYISGTSNVGIVASGGVRISNNVLVGIHDAGVVTWTHKYGILLFTDGDYTSAVDNNAVDMHANVVDLEDDGIWISPLEAPGAANIPTKETALSVRQNLVTKDGDKWWLFVKGWAATIQGNVCERLWVNGKQNLIEGNFAGSLAVNYDPITPAGFAVVNSRNKVVGNEIETGYIWDDTLFEGNSVRTELYFGNDCKLSGNYIDVLRDFVGIAGVVAGAERCIFTGNEFAGVSTGAGVAGQINIGSPFEFTGNYFTAAVEILDASNGVLTGNHFTDNLYLGRGTASVNVNVTGNRVGTNGLFLGDAGHVAERAVVSNNTVFDVIGVTGIYAFANNSTFTGNNLIWAAASGSILSVSGSKNLLSGNAAGDITVALGSNMIQGNHFYGDLTLVDTADSSMVSNNMGLAFGKGIILVNCDGVVITGNYVNAITFANNLERVVISGNYVMNDITLGAAGATQTNGVVLSGNYLGGQVLPGALTANTVIAMGNRVSGTILGVAVTAGNVVNTPDNANV